MQLPTPLLRKKPDAYKNTFGHALILAGSPRMLGAAALCGLSAMRAGAGLITLGVPKSLNLTLQRKIAPVLMTCPLAETPQHTFSAQAWKTLKANIQTFSAVAIGPGLTSSPPTQAFIKSVIRDCPLPLVIDADALNALAQGHLDLLLKSKAPKILTPHAGEFRRLLKRSTIPLETDMVARCRLAKDFAKRHNCVLILKGHRSIVAAPNGRDCYINRSGNAGMATAGSGDVLTGILTALLAQGVEAFTSAKWAAYLHGRAGDIASKKHGKASLIATDIIEAFPQALKASTRRSL
ncbi:MAG TPA: NAD(P)H-hydrate dehydratase [Candidatus Omnitrophota bacterium]|nr:NAD(P)H-hydrate dehydratase [Candidatus Omnitrophota bacterium]